MLEFGLSLKQHRIRQSCGKEIHHKVRDHRRLADKEESSVYLPIQASTMAKASPVRELMTTLRIFFYLHPRTQTLPESSC